MGSETAALSAASPLDLTSTVEFIHRLGGLAIAAHVDRKAFSVYSQLGFFPKEAGFDGVEVSRRVPKESPRLEEYSGLGLPLVGCSDSHYLGGDRHRGHRATSWQRPSSPSSPWPLPERRAGA